MRSTMTWQRLLAAAAIAVVINVLVDELLGIPSPIERIAARQAAKTRQQVVPTSLEPAQADPQTPNAHERAAVADQEVAALRKQGRYQEADQALQAAVDREVARAEQWFKEHGVFPQGGARAP